MSALHPTRFRTSQYGVESWHCFSAGPHYDPQRLACGPVIGLDEHVVAAGAGFDWHAHRGVQIVSWVLDGTLRHEDESGTPLLVGPGRLLAQSTAGGIRHRETNPAQSAPLRLLQLTVLGDAGPAVELAGTSVGLERAYVRVQPGAHPPAGGMACDAAGLRYGAGGGVVLVVDFTAAGMPDAAGPGPRPGAGGSRVGG